MHFTPEQQEEFPHITEIADVLKHAHVGEEKITPEQFTIADSLLYARLVFHTIEPLRVQAQERYRTQDFHEFDAMVDAHRKAAKDRVVATLHQVCGPDIDDETVGAMQGIFANAINAELKAIPVQYDPDRPAAKPGVTPTSRRPSKFAPSLPSTPSRS